MLCCVSQCQAFSSAAVEEVGAINLFVDLIDEHLGINDPMHYAMIIGWIYDYTILPFSWLNESLEIQI